MYYLGHNRQALNRLQDELCSKFPSIEAIDSKGLLDCVYLNAVVEEGLRIYSPAGAAHLSRIVPKGGCEISGKFIPEGVCFSPVLPLLLFQDFSLLFLHHTSPTAISHAHTYNPDPCISPPLVRPPRPHEFPCAVAVHPRALDPDHIRGPKGRQVRTKSAIFVRTERMFGKEVSLAIYLPYPPNSHQRSVRYG